LKWLRLYSEARNDAKLRYLQDDEFRVWFNLLCLSSEQEERGIINLCKQLLAVEVANGDVDLLDRTLGKLNMLKIATISDDTIEFINFKKRQYDNPSDQPEEVRKRVQKHRDEQKKRQCNDNVTNSNDTDTDTELDTEKEKEVDTPADITQSEIQILNTLRQVENYQFEYEKDLDMIRSFTLDYPNLDLLSEVKRWRDYKRDKPLMKKSSPRKQLRNWMIKAVEYQKDKPARASPDLKKKYEDIYIT